MKMFYKYLYLITIPGGTVVLNSKGIVSICTRNIDVLYMDINEADRDTLGNVSDELFYMLKDNYRYMGYPMIECIISAKVIGADDILSPYEYGINVSLYNLFLSVKNKRRVIHDGHISVIVDGTYIYPYDPKDEYSVSINLGNWRDKNILGRIEKIDTSSSSDEDI